MSQLNVFFLFSNRIRFQARSQNYERRLIGLSCLSICLPVTTRLPLEKFSWNLIFEYLSKISRKTQVPLKSDKNDGYFTWRPTYVFDHISLNSSWNENIIFSNCFCFRKSCRLWYIMEKYLEPRRQDDNMAHAHCMLDIKTTNTRSEYVIRIALPLQK